MLCDLLDELEKLRKSKAKRESIRDGIQKIAGVGDPYYLRSILNVTKSLIRLGEWIKAQRL